MKKIKGIMVKNIFGISCDLVFFTLRMCYDHKNSILNEAG